MDQIAITFDFHDTLARADRWFELEVRELVPAYLRWEAAEGGRPAPSDGTIATGKAAYAALRREISETGIEQDAVSCLVTVLGRMGIEGDEERIALGVDRLMAETFDEDVAPMPGAVATVESLADAGARLGVVSSAVYAPFLDWTLDRFGLRERFAVVTTSAGAGYYKSRPEIYTLTAAALGVPPEGVVHVGDSARYDVAGARRAGQRTVWIGNGKTLPEDGERADLVLGSLVDAAGPILGLARSAAGRPTPSGRDADA